MGKVYAVKRGKKPGIYHTWSECKAQTDHCDAEFKSFKTLAEAQAYMASPEPYYNVEKYNFKDFDAVIHTDGGCRNHGNVKGGHVKATDPSAWCYRIDMQDGTEKFYYRTDGKFGATNNEMELKAVCEALKDMRGQHNVPKLTTKKLLFVLDSKYVLYASRPGWLDSKARSGFKIINGQLWEQIYNLLQNYDHISWAWTHGHRGEQGNEFVDHTLNETMDLLESEQNENKDDAGFLSELVNTVYDERC